jgi:hypothetical protein
VITDCERQGYTQKRICAKLTIIARPPPPRAARGLRAWGKLEDMRGQWRHLFHCAARAEV